MIMTAECLSAFGTGGLPGEPTLMEGIFVSILNMHNQRFLVAYPVGLFYACFALLSVFDVGTSK
ncbi:hypothetical protein MEQU1_000800 [Malassezia equina]|uniref:Uncharacterized protein n=1 Tax=Malassezia equina TaxID=1381935 RepID=A0AAF0EAH7_9BASI|nr:hypothetical protein MEQU1_000800 [Malassezia equina]